MLKRTALVAFALLCVARTAAADSVPLTPGPYQAKYDNLETFTNPATGATCTTIVVGCVNSGIFVIETINTWPVFLHPIPWFTDSSAGEITGSFGGIVVTSVTANADGTFTINATGGTLSIYVDNTPDYDGTIANATNGTLMVSFNFIPGIVPGDPTTTVHGTASGITNPLSGEAFGYLDVIPGSGPWASFFDGNAIPGIVGAPPGADALEQSNFNSQTGIPAPWTLVSHDPVVGTIIPEPGSLMLLGAGLIGVGRSFKRRFNRAS